MAHHKKVRMVMLDDFRGFWKRGDKRRIHAEFVKALTDWGWAMTVEDYRAAAEKEKQCQ